MREGVFARGNEEKGWGLVAAAAELMASGQSAAEVAGAFVSVSSVLLSAQMSRQQWLSLCDEMWSEAAGQLTAEPNEGV